LGRGAGACSNISKREANHPEDESILSQPQEKCQQKVDRCAHFSQSTVTIAAGVRNFRVRLATGLGGRPSQLRVLHARPKGSNQNLARLTPRDPNVSRSRAVTGAKRDVSRAGCVDHRSRGVQGTAGDEALPTLHRFRHSRTHKVGGKPCAPVGALDWTPGDGGEMHTLG